MTGTFEEISLNKMKVFVAFVHHKTLTKTGRALGLSTSAINNVILSIEKTLGEQVFIRKMDHLTLTETGEELFQVAQEIMAVLEKVDLKKKKEKATEITVAATVWDTEFLLSAPLKEFKKTYPNVTLNLTVNTEYYNLSNNDCDVSIGLYAAKHPEINQRLITESTLKLYATQNYLKKYSSPKNMQDLKGHTLLTHKAMPPLPDNIYRDNQYGTTANSYTPLLDLALANLGIVVLPSEMATKDLVPVLPEFEAHRFGLFYLSRKSSDKEEFVEALFHLVKKHTQQGGGLKVA